MGCLGGFRMKLVVGNLVVSIFEECKGTLFLSLFPMRFPGLCCLIVGP